MTLNAVNLRKYKMINNIKDLNFDEKLEIPYLNLNNKIDESFDNDYQQFIEDSEDSDNIQINKTIKEDYNNKKQYNKTFDNLITLNDEITNDETNLMKIDDQFNNSKKKEFKEMKNIEFIPKINENSINLQNIKKINSNNNNNKNNYNNKNSNNNNNNNNIFSFFLQKNTFERIEVKEDTFKFDSSMLCNYQYITDFGQTSNNQILFENNLSNKYNYFFFLVKRGIQKMIFRNIINFSLLHKKGTLSNKLKKKGFKGKHDNRRFDNAIRKIIISCSKNIDSYIRDICCRYNVNNLHKLNIKKNIGYSFEDYFKFFNEYLKDIYRKFKPKRLKKEEIKGEYEHEIANLKNAIIKEKIDKKAETKTLQKLINETTFKRVLICYLCDDNEIISENGDLIQVEGFITYKDCLEEYDNALKEKYKKKIFDIINGKAKQRRKRNLNNNKLRFNIITQP